MKLRIPPRLFLYFSLIVLGASAFFFAVFIPSPQGFYVLIVVAALAGFSDAANICDTKRNNQALVCPTGSDCDAVIRSRYAKFLGISLEYWGMAYFFVVIVAYLLLLFMPQMFTPLMLFAIVFLPLAGGLFALYLLFVQAFILRHWCIWCLLTGILSLSIAVTSLVSVPVATALLARFRIVLDLLQLLGFILGVGGATSMAFLFFHFLRDAVIDEEELESIKAVSELIWVGFGLVLISEIARFVSHTDILLTSGTFVMQITALFVFALAGAVLMIIYEPFLVYMPFQAPAKGHSTSNFASLRRPTLTLGAIVLASWYFALAMRFISPMPHSLLLSIFAIVLLVAVGLAVLWDRHLATTRHT